MDEKQANRVICEGGLDTTENHLNMSANSPGGAVRLLNYEVGTDGGYSRLAGYNKLHDDDVGLAIAEGAVLGIIIFDNLTTDVTDIIAARKDTSGSTYSLYLYSSGGGWSKITTGLTLATTASGVTVLRLRYAVGNDGANNVLCIVDGVNKAVLYDGTNWSQIDSTGTGANIANAGGANALDAPYLVGFFKDTLFLGFDEINSAKGIMAYSAPNAFYDFLTASGAGQLIPGFPIQQFKSFRDELYIFGKNGIKKAVADTTSGFLVKDVTNNIGCIARDSVVELGGDLVFLAPDGFRPVTGTDKIGDIQLETISKPIHNLAIQSIASYTLDNMISVVIRGKSQFRLFFGDVSINDGEVYGIVGGLREQQGGFSWEFGEILGFNPNCITSQYIDNEEYVLHGGSDGKVYRQEQGDTQDGAEMLSVYKTPYLDFGDTEIRKVFEKITLFIKGETSFSMSLSVQYDWGKDDVSAPTNYILESSPVSVIYGGGALYDSGALYVGSLPALATSNIEGSFFSTSLTFVSYGNNYVHTIHGLIFEYSVKGRR